MDRINGQDWIDIGGGKRGFRSQNAGAGVPGTEVTDQFLNGVQEELAGVIEGSGQVLSSLNNAQLEKAVGLGVSRGKWIYAPDTSATPNLITVAPTPAVPALVAGLGLRVKVANTNSGPVTLTLAGLAAKPVLGAGGRGLVDGDLWAGDIYDLLYDGANWRSCTVPTVPTLRRPLTYYVNAATGSNLNSGVAPDAALATVQEAVSRAFQFGPSAHRITINVATGVYNPVLWPDIQGPAIDIVGNLANPVTVAVRSLVPGENAMNVRGGNIATVSGILFATSVAGAGVGVLARDGAKLVLKGCMADYCGGAAIQAITSSQVTVEAQSWVGGCTAGLHAGANSTIILVGPQTIAAPISVSLAFANAAGLGAIMCSPSVPVSFSGSAVTGIRYRADLNAFIDTVGGGPNRFPGSAAGVLATGGQYA